MTFLDWVFSRNKFETNVDKIDVLLYKALCLTTTIYSEDCFMDVDNYGSVRNNIQYDFSMYLTTNFDMFLNENKQNFIYTRNGYNKTYNEHINDLKNYYKNIKIDKNIRTEIKKKYLLKHGIFWNYY